MSLRITQGGPVDGWLGGWVVGGVSRIRDHGMGYGIQHAGHLSLCLYAKEKFVTAGFLPGISLAGLRTVGFGVGLLLPLTSSSF